MKYEDMSSEQQEAFRLVLLKIMSIKSTEEQGYSQQVLKLLVVANGSGILLLGTIMGIFAKQYDVLSKFHSPLWKFFIGALLVTIIYIPLLGVAHKATVFITNQIQAFFLNQLNIEEFQGYGLNKWGIRIIRFLYIASAFFLFWGVFQCVKILGNI